MCHFSFLYILLEKKGNWQSDLLKHVQIYINTCIYSIYEQRLSLYSIFNPFIGGGPVSDATEVTIHHF